MALSLSVEDKDELKKHTADLINALECSNKKEMEKLMNVLRRTRSEVYGISKRQEKLEQENRILKHQVSLLTQEVNAMIGQKRARNMIVYGLEEKVDEEEDTEGKVVLAENVFKEFKQVNIEILQEDIVTAERLGQLEPNRTAPRPILVKLVNPSIKKKIFVKGKELYLKRKISVSSDLTIAQRKERKEVLAVKKLFDGMGIRTKIKGLKLNWNEQLMDWEEALEVFHEWKDKNLNKEKRFEEPMSQRGFEEDQEDVLSDGSVCSQASAGRKRRAFSQNVLDSIQVNKKQSVPALPGKGALRPPAMGSASRKN